MKRLRTEQAVQFAAQSRWEDAIAANRAILAAFPEDAEAYNRLGKSLGETGKIKEAREAYQKALEIEPTNSIARKNLERLATAKGKAEPDQAHQVDASLFIEEMGKTGVTTLQRVNTRTLSTLSAGDYISDIEPKLAMRLSRLIDGGNKYAAAVAGIGDQTVRVIIKETFQHPTQVGRLSFPAGKAGDAIRPYTKESMVRSDMDDDEDVVDETEDWDETEADVDTEAEPREMGLFDAARAEEHDDNDFDE